MKKNVIKTLNVLFWIFVFLFVMIACYCSWSNYTIVSFIVSFLIYGGVTIFLCSSIDDIIEMYIKDK